ncbi:MAG: amidohydrolase family protein [Opitutaceae bacterium]|nr:amidohydrolase family protein [Opitutaceae bacterium]
MRIDAHQHFWQRDRFQYPWLTKELTNLQRDFAPEDLHPLLQKNAIDMALVVQTLNSLEETYWFLQLAEKNPFIGGVIGWVDLSDPLIGEQLAEFQSSKNLVGIRHQVHDEPDGNWLLHDDILSGLQALADHSLPYDLLIRPTHLPLCTELAKTLPSLSLIVDHIAKPGIAQKQWEPWAEDIAQLATLPNVSCKVSGLITEADWSSWKPEDLQPYVEHICHSFGSDRIMFGSNWPFCLLAGSYDHVIETITVLIDQIDDSYSAGFWGNNATRIYNLQSETKESA